MIVVRDVFQLKFGKAKDAVSIMKPMVEKMNDKKIGNYRLLTDLVGNYYTLVLEGTFNSMEDYQKVREQTQEDDWQKSYAKFTEVVINGYRDMWTVV
ncbi:MAG: hypothetical protein ABSG15_12485 [FCB group bacterium]|jgi:hypothetical protein